MRWLPARDGEAWLRFELESRGDRFQGRLQVPAGPGPWPLALIAGPEPGSLPRAEALALVGLDLPLLGERASPKWSERLEACLSRGPAGATDRALLDGFLAQALADLRRIVDLCAARSGLAAGRMGLVGIGPGALVGAALRALEPRLRAFALAPGGLAPALDPSQALGAPGLATLALLARGDEEGDRAPAWAQAAGLAPERSGRDPLGAALRLLAGRL